MENVSKLIHEMERRGYVCEIRGEHFTTRFIIFTKYDQFSVKLNVDEVERIHVKYSVRNIIIKMDAEIYGGEKY